MKESSFKTIRNGAIASVVASIAMLFFPSIWTVIKAAGRSMLNSATWLWHSFFNSSLQVTGWLLTSLIALALVGVVLVFRLTRSAKRWKVGYFYNMRWRWRWSWSGNGVLDLWCYCPRCDGTLVYDDSSCQTHYPEHHKTDFICENCNREVVGTISGGGWRYAISVIEREIDRRVRTGQYN